MLVSSHWDHYRYVWKLAVTEPVFKSGNPPHLYSTDKRSPITPPPGSVSAHQNNQPTAGEWGKMSEPDNQRKIRTERLESDTQSKFSHTLCKRLKRILCGVFYTLSLFFLSFLNSFCFDKTLFFFYFYMFMSLFLSMIFLRHWWINPKRFPFACGFTVSLGILTAVCVLSRLTLIVFGWCKRFQTHRRMNVD